MQIDVNNVHSWQGTEKFVPSKVLGPETEVSDSKMTNKVTTIHLSDLTA